MLEQIQLYTDLKSFKKFKDLIFKKEKAETNGDVLKIKYKY